MTTDKTKLAAARDDVELIHFWLPDEFEPATPAYEALERIKAIVTQAIGEETDGIPHPPAVDWIEGLAEQINQIKDHCDGKIDADIEGPNDYMIIDGICDRALSVIAEARKRGSYSGS